VPAREVLENGNGFELPKRANAQNKAPVTATLAAIAAITPHP
jgi:hypothetical protein